MQDKESRQQYVKMSRVYINLAKVTNKRLNHFPAHERQGLARIIRDKLYQLCEYQVEAQKRYRKSTALTNLDITHQQLRVHLFVAKEEGYFQHPACRNNSATPAQLNQDRYDALTTIVDEYGKFIGSWIKKEKTRDAARSSSA